MEALGKLGIDFNSVVLYLINFGILFAVVAYFITGPIMRMVDQRRQTIKDNLEEAERIKREFVAEQKKAAVEKEALRAEMEIQLSHLKKNLEKKRKEQEETLTLKKAKIMEELRTLVEEEKGSIVKKAEQHTLDLIAKVILHIVSHKIPQEVVEESVREAWKTYQK